MRINNPWWKRAETNRWSRQALSYSHTRTGSKVSHEYDIFSSTYGILFFGTPHAGSEKANWLAYLKNISLSTHSNLVSALEKESETLQNITDYFVPLMKNFSIFFFWEQRMTKLKVGLKDYIVSRESAAPLYDDTERAGIEADHSGMVKFDKPSSQAFQMVIDALLRYCAEAPAVISRNRAYAAEFLNRERNRQALEVLHSMPDSPLGTFMTSEAWDLRGRAMIEGFGATQFPGASKGRERG